MRRVDVRQHSWRVVALPRAAQVDDRHEDAGRRQTAIGVSTPPSSPGQTVDAVAPAAGRCRCGACRPSPPRAAGACLAVPRDHPAALARADERLAASGGSASPGSRGRGRRAASPGRARAGGPCARRGRASESVYGTGPGNAAPFGSSGVPPHGVGFAVPAYRRPSASTDIGYQTPPPPASQRMRPRLLDRVELPADRAGGRVERVDRAAADAAVADRAVKTSPSRRPARRRRTAPCAARQVPAPELLSRLSRRARTRPRRWRRRPGPRRRRARSGPRWPRRTGAPSAAHRSRGRARRRCCAGPARRRCRDPATGVDAKIPENGRLRPEAGSASWPGAAPASRSRSTSPARRACRRGRRSEAARRWPAVPPPHAGDRRPRGRSRDGIRAEIWNPRAVATLARVKAAASWRFPSRRAALVPARRCAAQARRPRRRHRRRSSTSGSRSPTARHQDDAPSWRYRGDYARFSPPQQRQEAAHAHLRPTRSSGDRRPDRLHRRRSSRTQQKILLLFLDYRGKVPYYGALPADRAKPGMKGIFTIR